MKPIICFFLVITFFQIQAQSNIKIGTKAPTINPTDWIINVPQDKSLKNKNIVLEFWATWCGPCIAAVPHLNELQSKFKGENLYFVSITDESVDKVQRISKRIDFKSIVVSDQTKKTQVQFGDGKEGLDLFPMTVLIDKNNIIQWIGDPKNLNEKILKDFLIDSLKVKETSITEVPKITIDATNSDVIKDRIEEKIPLKPIDKKPIYQFEMSKSNVTTSEFAKLEYIYFSCSGVKLDEIFSLVLNISNKNIILPEAFSIQKFDIVFKDVKKMGKDWGKLEENILYSLDLVKRKEMQNFAIYNCTIQDEKLLEKAIDKSSSSKSQADTKLLLTSISISDLMKTLNDFSNIRFLFEGKNDDVYDFVIEIKSDEEILKSLKSYGIIAKAGNEFIEMVIFEKK